MEIREYMINSNFSGALVEINGEHKAMKSIREDRIYFIVEGEGKFIINGEERSVSVEDLIFIPKGISYNLNGRMKYFLVCSPGFNPEGDIFLNN